MSASLRRRETGQRTTCADCESIIESGAPRWTDRIYVMRDGGDGNEVDATYCETCGASRKVEQGKKAATGKDPPSKVTEQRPDRARVTFRSEYGRVEVEFESFKREGETDEALIQRVSRAAFAEWVERTTGGQ